MSDTLIKAALDDAYKTGVIDADTAACQAIWHLFGHYRRPSLLKLRDELLNAVGVATDAAILERIGEARSTAVSVRASLSPHDGTGNPVRQ